MLSTATPLPVSLFVTAVPEIANAAEIIGSVSRSVERRRQTERSQTTQAADNELKQLQFDWSTDENAATATTTSVGETSDDSPVAKSATSDRQVPAVSGPRIRKLKRIRRRQPERDVIGGDLWESVETDHSHALPKPSRPGATPHSSVAIAESRQQAAVAGRAALAGGRMAQPVRIGAAMLQLLKRYGITDEEIQAGINAFANRTCHATAS